MGNASSSPESSKSQDEEVVCLDCDKKNQKDLPADDPVSQRGQPCADIYERVTDCMNSNKGQISSCTEEWESFRRCHQQEQQKGR